MSVYRPGGVIAIASFFILISSLGFLIGIQTAASSLGYYGKVFYYIFLFQIPEIYTLTVQMGPLYDFILFLSVLSDLSSTSITPLTVLAIQIVSGVYLITSVGLLYMSRWGRRLGLIIGVLHIAAGIISLIFIPSIIFLGGIIVLISGIVIVWYLTRDVKYEFDKKREIQKIEQ